MNVRLSASRRAALRESADDVLHEAVRQKQLTHVHLEEMKKFRCKDLIT